MKTLLVSILLLTGFAAAAQNTNLVLTFRTEVSGVGTNSFTNTVTLRINGDGNNKEKALLKGTVWAWGQYRTTGTNGTATLEDWLKDGDKARLTVYANRYSALVNAARAQKLADLLTTQSDALSTSDFSSIDSIVAKWTAP